MRAHASLHGDVSVMPTPFVNSRAQHTAYQGEGGGGTSSGKPCCQMLYLDQTNIKQEKLRTGQKLPQTLVGSLSIIV